MDRAQNPPVYTAKRCRLGTTASSHTLGVYGVDHARGRALVASRRPLTSLGVRGPSGPRVGANSIMHGHVRDLVTRVWAPSRSKARSYVPKPFSGRVGAQGQATP